MVDDTTRVGSDDADMDTAIEFTYPQITDWMYVEDGRLVGGYTMRAIRDRLSSDARAKFDAGSPFAF